MKNEYIIINRTTLEKRIEELEKEYKKELKQPNDIMCTLSKGMIGAYKDVLSQSTPLIPEIEKAYEAGKLDEELSLSFDNPKGRFITNLKLDI